MVPSLNSTTKQLHTASACSSRCSLLLTTQVDHESAAPGQEAGTHFEPADCWSDLYDAFEQAEILIYIIGGWLRS